MLAFVSAAKGFTLVTGASTGIGRELALIAATKACPLVLVARSEDKLNELAREVRETHGVRAEVVALDLGEPDAPAALFREMKRREVEIEVLINNAGFGSLGGSTTHRSTCNSRCCDSTSLPSFT
jgi:hypothetical protein